MQNDDIAIAKLDFTEPFGEPFVPPADSKKIEPRHIKEGEFPGTATDQARMFTDNGLHHARVFGSNGCIAAFGKGEPALHYDLIQSLRFTLQQQQITLAQQRVRQGDAALTVAADHAEHNGLSATQTLHIGKCLTDADGLYGDVDFGRVVFDFQRSFHGRIFARPGRKQFVAERQENHAGQSQRSTDWCEVEHGERDARQLLSNPRHDDVRGGTNLCHQPAE